MYKILLTIILLCFTWNVDADTVQRYQTYNTKDTVTAVNLNGNFDNILNAVNGGLDNNNADTEDGFRFIEILEALPAAGNQGRVVFLTADNTLQFDTGSAWIPTALLPNNQTFTGDNTFTGTTTFSTISTANIDGGTLDNVIIGEDTAAKGTFTSVHLEETTAPATAAGEGSVYTKDTSGQPELFYREESSGDEVQLTDSGLTVGSFTGIPTNVQVFTSNGTWTRPAHIDTVYVKVWGGGGAGGAGSSANNGGGGGGGGGGYAEGLIAVTGNVTVTAGTGTCSFAGSTTIQATAGGAAQAADIGGAGGTAGVGSNGTINLTGMTGGDGSDLGTLGLGGAGGGSPLGGATAPGGDAGGSAGEAGIVPGGGGAGGGSSGGSGGSAGAASTGMVIVYY